MKQLKLTLLLMACVILQYGCANDSTSDFIDTSGVSDITYTNTTKSIFDNNCIPCHATVPINGAPMPLTTYEFVKSAVLTRPLLDRISREQGTPGMMPNGGTRLPQAKITQIFKWAQNGLPE
jgi:mono/diheme cytochrome c family protein